MLSNDGSVGTKKATLATISTKVIAKSCLIEAFSARDYEGSVVEKKQDDFEGVRASSPSFFRVEIEAPSPSFFSGD
jgi:hypothetical protein